MLLVYVFIVVVGPIVYCGAAREVLVSVPGSFAIFCRATRLSS